MLAVLLAAALPQEIDLWRLVAPHGPGFQRPITASAGGDFDGDGAVDLVFAYGATQRLVMHVGGPGANFLETKVIDEHLDFVEEILVRDLDGDGDLDLATVTRNSQLVTVHLGDGEGHFAPRLQVDGSVSLGSGLAAGDIDGDGDVDLVASFRGSGLIAWYAQEATGTYGARQVVASGLAGVLDVAVEDVDGDGHLDLVYTAGASGDVGVISALGGGAFGAPDVRATFAEPLHSVEFGDVDGDGDRDLVGPSAAGVRRLTNENGQLVSAAPVSPVDWNVGSLALGDMDQNGVVDVVVGNVVFTLQPDGSFGTQDVVFDPPFFLGINVTTTENVLVQDFDGDGRLDVCNGARRFDQSSTPGVLIERNLLVEPTVQQRVSLGDFDLDGDLDLIYAGDGVVAGQFDVGKSVEVRLGDGDGEFGQRLYFANVLPGNGPTPLVLDINGDGAPDLFQRNLFVLPRIALGSGTGFGPPVDVPQLNLLAPRFVDADGDGDLDAFSFVANTGELLHSENIGGQSFAQPRVVASGILSVADFADVNADGVSDVLVSRPTTNPGSTFERYAVALGDPGDPGSFGAFTNVGSSIPSLAAGAFVDLNGDGALDVDSAPIQSGANTREVHFGDGAGGFGPALERQLSGLGWLGLSYADFNGDGFVDLVTRRSLGFGRSQLLVSLGDGTGAFGAPLEGPMTGNTFTILLGDLDSDGDDDLILGAGIGTVTVESRTSLGQLVCDGVPNSTGAPAHLGVAGSPRAPTASAPSGQVVLTASGVPASQTVLFVNGTSTALVPGAGGSQGTLCLGGSLSRYTRPGEIQFADGAGRARLRLDLAATPIANVLATVSAGQSLVFQAWYRDTNPGPASNFTSAVQVTFL